MSVSVSVSDVDVDVDVDVVTPLSPAQLARSLASLNDGPYRDADTAGVAGLAAETARYLGHAVPSGGVTDPATVTAVAGDLSLLAARLPALVASLGAWLMNESAAGRLTDDQRRPPAEMAAKVVMASSDACQSARELARALNTLIELTEPLHADAAAAADGAGAAA
jgi:hypothetical protein